MLGGRLDLEREAELAAELYQEFGVDIDAVSAVADIALARIDREILEGRMTIQ